MKFNFKSLHDSINLELKSYYGMYPLETMGLLVNIMHNIVISIEENDNKLDNIVSTVGLDELISEFNQGIQRAEKMVSACQTHS